MLPQKTREGIINQESRHLSNIHLCICYIQKIEQNNEKNIQNIQTVRSSQGANA